MKYRDESGRRSRHKERPHRTPYLGTNIIEGVTIQCQYCSGQTFRRSSLRADDFYQFLLMRYPVRCLRCSQRQMVSFAIAGTAISSKIKPQRPARPTVTNWNEPTTDSKPAETVNGQ